MDKCRRDYSRYISGAIPLHPIYPIYGAVWAVPSCLCMYAKCEPVHLTLRRYERRRYDRASILETPTYNKIIRIITHMTVDYNTHTRETSASIQPFIVNMEGGHGPYHLPRLSFPIPRPLSLLTHVSTIACSRKNFFRQDSED